MWFCCGVLVVLYFTEVLSFFFLQFLFLSLCAVILYGTPFKNDTSNSGLVFEVFCCSSCHNSTFYLFSVCLLLVLTLTCGSLRPLSPLGTQIM